MDRCSSNSSLRKINCTEMLPIPRGTTVDQHHEVGNYSECDKPAGNRANFFYYQIDTNGNCDYISSDLKMQLYLLVGASICI